MKRLAALACLLAAMVAAQAQQANRAIRGPLPRIVWRPPPRMTIQDWTCGPGGCARTPRPPFYFQREDTSGTNAKMYVRDARGRTWDVKFGAPVIAETFAPRFNMALGYLGEYTYFVPEGKVVGAHRLKRCHYFVHDGVFRRARFELRGQKNLVFLKNHAWSWTNNPFLGTPQFAGLKIVIMLLSDWDTKDIRDGEESANVGVFRVPGLNGPELFYGMFDWGAALGRWGGTLRQKKSDCAAFARDTPHFVQGVRGNMVQFGFWGKHGEDIRSGITVEDVRWLLPWLRRVTPLEIRYALKISGATERQAGCWTNSIQDRIRQLEAAAR